MFEKVYDGYWFLSNGSLRLFVMWSISIRDNWYSGTRCKEIVKRQSRERGVEILMIRRLFRIFLADVSIEKKWISKYEMLKKNSYQCWKTFQCTTIYIRKKKKKKRNRKISDTNLVPRKRTARNQHFVLQ